MIEKNIPQNPFTPYQGLGDRMSSYPFMEMEIGDSVFFEGCASTADCKPYGAAKKYAKRSGDRRFSARKVEGGVRIWRIE